MIRKLLRLVFSPLVIILLYTGNANAEVKASVYDSTCCAPDSLRVTSVNHPVFCVIWRVPSDSSCQTPLGFEIEWKPLFGTVWQSKVVTYTSGTTITFCDSAAGCGTHQWRVRTICNDSTYSDWVYGNKFNMPCGVARGRAPEPSISTIAYYNNITDNTDRGWARLVQPFTANFRLRLYSTSKFISWMLAS